MKPRAILLSLLLAFFVNYAVSQDSTNKQADVAQYVQRLMDVQVAFTRMVPAGMSIEAKEISRTGGSGKDLVVKYHVFVKGTPQDALFKWIQWPVGADEPSSPLDGISAGRDGLLMCAGRKPEQCGDPKKPDDPIDFIAMPRKGEPTRLAFVSDEIKIGILIVPDPIEASDKGCTLSAVRLTPKFDLAFISGTGYPPNSDIHYKVTSEKSSDQIIKSDNSGMIRVSVIPYPGKKTEGTSTVKIMENKCSPEVSFEWGKI